MTSSSLNVILSFSLHFQSNSLVLLHLLSYFLFDVLLDDVLFHFLLHSNLLLLFRFFLNKLFTDFFILLFHNGDSISQSFNLLLFSSWNLVSNELSLYRSLIKFWSYGILFGSVLKNLRLGLFKLFYSFDWLVILSLKSIDSAMQELNLKCLLLG